jgi:hypothetical protein
MASERPKSGIGWSPDPSRHVIMSELNFRKNRVTEAFSIGVFTVYSSPPPKLTLALEAFKTCVAISVSGIHCIVGLWLTMTTEEFPSMLGTWLQD